MVQSSVAGPTNYNNYTIMGGLYGLTNVLLLATLLSTHHDKANKCTQSHTNQHDTNTHHASQQVHDTSMSQTRQ